MRTAIIISSRDPASLTVKHAMLCTGFKLTGESFEGMPVYAHHSYPEAKLYTTESESVHCENIDNTIDADFFVFATRHQSKSGIPSLSVHVQGNWGKAELGGKDRTLGIAWPGYMREAFVFLNKHRIKGYDVVYEATHHGPYLEKPSMFIEIGSTEEQWRDSDAASLIAKAIMQIITVPVKKYTVCFGIGGLHTCPVFNRKVLDHDIAIAHVCPKYMLGFLDEEMIKQALERTVERVDFILLDWKGLGQHKDRIKALVENAGVPWKKADAL